MRAQRQVPLLPAAVGLRAEPGGVEGHACRFEDGGAHVHGDAAVGAHARLDHAGQRLHADLGRLASALVRHEAGEAARAVAALLHLAAVGVVDHVFESRCPRRRRGPHREDLVGADAEMAVGQLRGTARR
jgi:hypothetical protein